MTETGGAMSVRYSKKLIDKFLSQCYTIQGSETKGSSWRKGMKSKF